MLFRARAPLRLGLAGGGTDVSPYCDEFGGAVLNVTLAFFAEASLSLGGSEVVFCASDMGITEIHSLSLPLADTSGKINASLQLHRAVYNRIMRDFNGGVALPLTLTTEIEAPPGSGLGSSSALVVAMVEAFRAALNLPLGRYDVAHLAFEIERLDLGQKGGRQDQYAATFGGINFMEFLSNDRVIVNPLRVSPNISQELEASILLCFSGISRDSASIISDQIAAVGNKASDSLQAMHAIKDNAHVMKRAVLLGDFETIFTLFDTSWEEKKRTAPSVSNVRIERLYSVALANGARAGKISGAGGGGFLFFFVDPARRKTLAQALEAEGAKTQYCRFNSEGASSWAARDWQSKDWKILR